MAKSGRNEIVGARKGCCQITGPFVMCYIVVNVTDELLRDLGHDCMLKVHPLFNDLPCIGWKDFARLRAPLRYTENVVLQCSCAMSSIGIQTDLANGAEFRELETGLLRDDALVQTREKVRSVNFTSEEIVEVTDDLTVVTSKTVLHARESVMLTAAETEGETCESLICPIADAEKRPRDPTARDVATAAAPQEAEASRNSLVLAHEASEVSGETLDEKIPAAEEMRMDDDVCAMSVKRAVKKNSLDTAAITVVVTGEEREEIRQSAKDMLQVSVQSTYEMRRFRKTRAIKDTEDETLPAEEPLVCNGSRRRSRTRRETSWLKEDRVTKGIERCSTDTSSSFIERARTTKRSCDRSGRSTVRRDCRQLEALQSRCYVRSGYCDTAHLSLRNEAAPSAVSDPVCYPVPQDSCVTRCRSDYWCWWGKTCDVNGKHRAATFGNSLHTHCNGDTGYHYWAHFSDIDNCPRTTHWHCSGGRSVWNNDRRS